MKRFHSLVPIGLGALLLGGAAGCLLLKPPPPAARFYVLRPVPPAQPLKVENAPCLAVAYVKAAAYLRRSGIATRAAAHRLRYAQTHRWAEPIEKGVGRVLTEDLAMRLGANQVVGPGYAAAPAGCVELHLSIDAFETGPDNAVRFAGSWRLIDARTRRVLRASAFAFTEQAVAQPDDFEPVAAALSRAVGLLADRICRDPALASP
ncbi:MAG: membrane integrity-associated transporter subunit PqiC [Verrucomicrobia bacterium]|nr:membrane integrity-associated transporter subunit PqiC [Verrucomicrobiota bacterium]